MSSIWTSEGLSSSILPILLSVGIVASLSGHLHSVSLVWFSDMTYVSGIIGNLESPLELRLHAES